MKKLNKKGFTLIELLAVIVIMGILMVVAIPAVTRTINNTRKDTYINTAKQYVNQVKTLWASDGLLCGTQNSSIAASGNYYISTSSADDALLEEGGKSPWKNDTKGYVLVNRDTNGKNTYSIYLVDAAGNAIGSSVSAPAAFDSMTRSDVKTLTPDAYSSFASAPSGYTLCKVQ